MFATLTRWLSRPSARKSCPSTRVRLGVEALEIREVLSGGLAAGYSFGPGNYIYENTPSGAQLVYDGSQQVVEMVALGNGGVDTLFSGGGVYYSPDGRNLAGGGNTVLASDSNQSVRQLIGAGGGVDTQFSGGAVFFSPDGRNLAGGGGSVVAYFGSQSVVQMVADRGGVDTLFSGGGVYYSPDGRNLAGGGNTQMLGSSLAPGYFVGPGSSIYLNTPGGAVDVYDGSQQVVAMVALSNGGVDTLFSGGGVYYSPDGRNLGGG
ncbi:MAG TPA: hypothetical protein VH092_02095, partial [Urbifossiella sp.]|nr:hypothetical protein [Urbifossiella sp.]